MIVEEVGRDEKHPTCTVLPEDRPDHVEALGEAVVEGEKEGVRGKRNPAEPVCGHLVVTHAPEPFGHECHIGLELAAVFIMVILEMRQIFVADDMVAKRDDVLGKEPLPDLYGDLLERSAC